MPATAAAAIASEVSEFRVSGRTGCRLDARTSKGSVVAGLVVGRSVPVSMAGPGSLFADSSVVGPTPKTINRTIGCAATSVWLAARIPWPGTMMRNDTVRADRLHIASISV